MTPESITVSLEMAKALKKAGWEQGKSFLLCMGHDTEKELTPPFPRDNGDEDIITGVFKTLKEDERTGLYSIDLPTAEEILSELPVVINCKQCEPKRRYCHVECNCQCHERLPTKIRKWKYWTVMRDGNKYCILYGEDLQTGHGEFSDTLANAAAKMWLYLKENNLLPTDND